MFNCRRVTRLCSEALERDLSPVERMGVNLHTGLCEGCRNFRRQLQWLRQAARRYARGDTGQRKDIDPSAPPTV